MKQIVLEEEQERDMADELRPDDGSSAPSADERAEAMRERKESVVLDTLRAKVAGVDLESAALSLGGTYDPEEKTVELYLLDEPLWLDAQFTVRSRSGQADFEDTAIILNALLRPGGRPGDGWRAFRELAAGHAGDFHDEAEAPLSGATDAVAEHAEGIASAVGGRVVESVAGADASLEVPLFPNVRALVQVFREDMEFPAEARILFSDGADRFLPPGCLEELGARLSERILAAAGSLTQN